VRAGLLALTLLLAAMGSVAASEPDAERARLESLRAEIARLQAQIAEKRGTHGGLTGELRAAEQSIAKAARQLRRVEGDLARQGERLAGLREERAAREHTLQGHHATLAAQARAAYAMGRQERLKILLNQQDPARLSRAMIYYEYLSAARARAIAAIGEDLDRLVETEREIRREEARLDALRAEQADELVRLESAQQQRRALVDTLGRELADQDEQLDRLRADERDLEILLLRLEQALADVPLEQAQAAAFGELRGRLPWPAHGRIVQSFGTPRLGSLSWDGVMIAATEGEEVRAVHHGRVAFADWLRGFGMLLIVDHGDGYMTLYGHNQTLFKEAGDWVDVNETVALIGSSGGRDKSGVYFGIRHQGRAVDPVRWCAGRPGRAAG
jgi:septal ring factor EnvC (AmiA/AmiB activator)